MTSIALVIGVAAYASLTELPACRNDAKSIANILRASKRFAEVFEITENCEATAIKEEIINIVKTYQDTPIDQFLFYFSGHGDGDDSDFYFLPSDYSSERVRQTSLENSELDRLVKNLSPNLYVKIVDACHSGVSYIKNNDAIGKALKSSVGSDFKKVYFLFSSLSSQSSYADSTSSEFTRSIMKAINSYEGPSIRYKELMDRVSDQFSTNKSQRPLFVVQAEFTEIFIDIDDMIRDITSKHDPSPVIVDNSNITVGRESSIIEAIRKDSIRYCTQSDATIALNAVAERLRDRQPETLLSEIYEFDCHRQQVVIFLMERLSEDG